MPFSSNSSNKASAIAPPMSGSVPLPNSSMSMSESQSPFFTMLFIFSRCDEYVERSFSMLCSSPMSMNMLLNTPISLSLLTGTSSPHCIMYCRSPTVFKHTDLPPAFGPLMSNMRLPCGRRTSSGTIFLPWLLNDSSNIGWRAPIRLMTLESLTTGLMPSSSLAKRAFAKTKSTYPRNSKHVAISGRRGRKVSAKAVNMAMISLFSSALSSHKRLLPSTTASGSM